MRKLNANGFHGSHSTEINTNNSRFFHSRRSRRDCFWNVGSTACRLKIECRFMSADAKTTTGTVRGKKKQKRKIELIRWYRCDGKQNISK